MMKRSLLLGVILALVALVVWAPWQSAPTHAQTGQPLEQLSGDEFDRVFLTQMTMHHGMAVLMARPVVANAPHQELRDLGTAIIADQTREIAQMRTWAKDWYSMDIPDPVAMMDGMQGNQPAPGGHAGHDGMTGGMHGQMMHDMSMMGDLWKLPPNRLEAVFMSLMIPHHDGAIEMARLVPDRAAHQELKDLAQQIVASQSTEIQQMNTWLAAWYGL